MEIKLFRSATVGIYSKNFKLLMDPWLVDGEYFGSWSHYPYYDLEKNIDEINSFNAIYISHIHPDHCSEKTLKLINKNIPVYIHSFHTKFLKFKIETLGFKVIELPNFKRTEIGKDFFLNIIAADNCNPELCYKFMACADMSAKNNESQQIDTLAVIDDNKSTILNVNDCPYELAENTLNLINKNYEKIDLLLTGYQNASSYPQCFDNLNNKDKLIMGKKISDICLNRSLNFIKKTRPKYFLPFAGTYSLSGNLSKIDNLRGVANIDYAFDYLCNHQKTSKPSKISCEQIFDLTSNQSSGEYVKFNKENYNNYLNNILAKKTLDYENSEIVSFEEIYELAQMAHKKYIEKKKINNIKLNTDILIHVDDKIINLKKNNKLTVEKIDEIVENKKFVLYRTNKKLLKLLLMGPRYAHWNNAEIGSHLNFYRKPDTFERNVHGSMNYFHC